MTEEEVDITIDQIVGEASKEEEEIEKIEGTTGLVLFLENKMHYHRIKD